MLSVYVSSGYLPWTPGSGHMESPVFHARAVKTLVDYFQTPSRVWLEYGKIWYSSYFSQFPESLTRLSLRRWWQLKLTQIEKNCFWVLSRCISFTRPVTFSCRPWCHQALSILQQNTKVTNHGVASLSTTVYIVHSTPTIYQ